MCKKYFFFVFLLGIQFSVYSQNGKADEIIDQCLALPKDKQSDCLNKSSEAYFRKDLDLAGELCRKALSIAEEIENDTLIAQSNKYLAFINRNLGNYNEALGYAKESVEYYLELKDSMEAGFVYSILGSTYNFIGNKENALEAFKKGEEIYLEMLEKDADNSDVISRLAILYNDMGLFFFAPVKDYTKAKEYFMEALELAEKIGDSMQINSLIANLGMTFYKEGDDKKALENYKQALDMAKRLGNEMFAANISNNIANIYNDGKRFEEAREYFQASLEVYKNFNTPYQIGKAKVSIGKSWLDEMHYTNALHWFLRAIPELEKSGGELKLQETYKYISGCYEKTGKIDSAYHYFKIATNLNDSINEQESEKRYQELLVKYETEKTERENEILKNRNERQRAYQRFLILVILAVIVIAIILIFYFQQKKKNLQQKKQLAEQENNNLKERLEYRNRELTTNAMHLVKLNMLSENIIPKIRDSLGHTDSFGKQNLNEIIRELEYNIQEDAWKEFETRFEQVHTDFYKELNEKHPDLTPTEIRTCAFLKLNMSTKDVAALTNKSYRTVEKTRTNIRKKMELPSDTNLVNYLIGLTS